MSKHLGKKVGGERRQERRRAVDLRIEEGPEDDGEGGVVVREEAGEVGEGGWQVRDDEEAMVIGGLRIAAGRT